VLRLSRLDPNDPSGTKRRHFEISIDSPFHILSCLATQTHTALPEYSGPTAPVPRQTFECGCPNAACITEDSPASSTGSVPTLQSFTDPFGLDGSATTDLAPPAQAHIHSDASTVVRPIHMMRHPSYNPPAFDAEEAPPPMQTPPPLYDQLFGTPSQNSLADYFARFVLLIVLPNRCSSAVSIYVLQLTLFPSGWQMPILTRKIRTTKDSPEPRVVLAVLTFRIHVHRGIALLAEVWT
jgi:hypothetical protein